MLADSSSSYAARVKESWLTAQLLEAWRSRRWIRADEFSRDLRARGHAVSLGLNVLLIDNRMVEDRKPDGIPWWVRPWRDELR